MTPHRLAENKSVAFLQSFHVEILRGGMNRLLLRSMPSSDQPSRIEVLFQYVQHLEMPMAFEGLLIEDATSHDGVQSPWLTCLSSILNAASFVCLRMDDSEAGW